MTADVSDEDVKANSSNRDGWGALSGTFMTLFKIVEFDLVGDRVVVSILGWFDDVIWLGGVLRIFMMLWRFDRLCFGRLGTLMSNRLSVRWTLGGLLWTH